MQQQAPTTIDIATTIKDQRWNPSRGARVEILVPVYGTIPAPIDAESLIRVEQLGLGDRVMVHLDGQWYPAEVINAPNDGVVLVEYRFAGVPEHVDVPLSRVVPADCHRCSLGARVERELAEQWAAVVWRELAAHGAAMAARS